MHVVATSQQVGSDAAAHMAYANNANGMWRGAGRHDCTSRLALEMDIRIPKPSPSVTIAVPP